MMQRCLCASESINTELTIKKTKLACSVFVAHVLFEGINRMVFMAQHNV